MSEQRLQGFTRDYLRSLFHYDPDTGLITRRVRRQTQRAGTVVGTVDGKGYLHVNLDGRFVRLHRLAWFMETGVVPVKGIDHRNNIRTDNRWSNLREASQHGNSGNIGLPSHNRSGFKGVSKNTRSGLWHAQIKLFGKQTCIGRYADIRAAALVYNHAAEQHFGEFAKLNDVPGFGRFSVPPEIVDLFV